MEENNKKSEMIEQYLEDRKKFTAEELGAEYQKQADAFKEEVSKINDADTLHSMEAEIIQKLNEYDEYVRPLKYRIPDNCVFDGKEYKRADVVGKMIYFINKQEVAWNYALGLYGLVKFWKSNADMASYGVLDSTLRILGQSKCRGFEEWRDMLVINEFTKSMDEDYTKDLTLQSFLAHKHNSIISRLELVEPKAPAALEGV